MLYKYAPWQEEKEDKKKENFTKRNIETSVLYFNTPDSFNDPFDNAPSYNISFESRKKLLDLCLQDSASNFSDAFINKMYNISDPEFNFILKYTDYDKLNNAKRGITCFSRDNASILMWSHYANNHSGVCLGFDIDESDEYLIKFFDETKNQKLFLDGRVCRLLPIEYVSFNKRPSIDMTNAQESWWKILTFKSDLWKYEAEERIMIYSNNQIIFPRTLHYKPDCLKEIICGANMTLKAFIELKIFVDKLPNANNISIFVATLSESDYELYIRKLDSESLQMISKNYSILRSFDKELKRSAVYELKKKYEISEQNIKKYWKKALDNMLIHRIVSDFEFDKIKVAEMVKKRDNVAEESLTQKDVIYLFMNSMANDIKYFASRC